MLSTRKEMLEYLAVRCSPDLMSMDHSQIIRCMAGMDQRSTAYRRPNSVLSEPGKRPELTLDLAKANGLERLLATSPGHYCGRDGRSTDPQF